MVAISTLMIIFAIPALAQGQGGTPVWTNRFNGPANSGDFARTVAVDSSGNVFVSGSSRDTNGNLDYATVAYSGGGLPLWTNRYNGLGSAQGFFLALDSSGNVFVTGHTSGTNGLSDYATVAYSGGGLPLWTNRYNGPGDAIDFPTAMAVDGNGHVFVTGLIRTS